MRQNRPSIETIRELRESLDGDIVRTPTIRCAGIEDLLDDGTKVYGKLEFLQRTGTFKARGALAVLRSLGRERLAAGVTAVSAGNHAIATAYAAKVYDTHAKVVMIGGANPARVAAAKSFGADVVMAPDAHSAFEMAEVIRKNEGRCYVHPFEGAEIAAGTGTIGLEVCEDCADFDAIVVPIGGGGLIAGLSAAIKQLRPTCEIIGVEPEGADSMHRSFAADEPRGIDRVRTIADSLGAPFAKPYSFALCRDNVDRLVKVADSELKQAMVYLLQCMKFAVEPACAASTAALLGPLRQSLSGKRVVLVFCGSNIDWATFQSQAILSDQHAAR